MEQKLQIVIDTLKEELKSSLLSCDLWSKNNKTSIVDFNNNFNFSANFGDTLTNFEEKLNSLGLPIPGNYALFELEMDTLLLFINLDQTYILGALIDKSKINISSLFIITIPKIIQTYNEL